MHHMASVWNSYPGVCVCVLWTQWHLKNLHQNRRLLRARLERAIRGNEVQTGQIVYLGPGCLVCDSSISLSTAVTNVPQFAVKSGPPCISLRTEQWNQLILISCQSIIYLYCSLCANAETLCLTGETFERQKKGKKNNLHYLIRRIWICNLFKIFSC